jgi:DNA-binding phage protein
VSEQEDLEHRLSRLERDEIVQMSQTLRSLSHIARIVGVSRQTLDRIVCRPWCRTRSTTISRVRRALALRRVVVHQAEGMH